MFLHWECCIHYPQDSSPCESHMTLLFFSTISNSLSILTFAMCSFESLHYSVYELFEIHIATMKGFPLSLIFICYGTRVTKHRGGCWNSILSIDFNVILKGLGMVQEKQSVLAFSYAKEEYKTKLYWSPRVGIFVIQATLPTLSREGKSLRWHCMNVLPIDRFPKYLVNRVNSIITFGYAFFFFYF